ncbi:hypothetical protein AcW2_007095 [Taiwanofungus camphoratus]|nr:hypothetical protein AcW2_007095 [Antrodia cinnamomea]
MEQAVRRECDDVTYYVREMLKVEVQGRKTGEHPVAEAVHARAQRQDSQFSYAPEVRDYGLWVVQLRSGGALGVLTRYLR